jgi:hypothetical protein
MDTEVLTEEDADREVCVLEVKTFAVFGQAKCSKGTRGMPRREQAKKDVASCEKPWGAARRL